MKVTPFRTRAVWEWTMKVTPFRTRVVWEWTTLTCMDILFELLYTSVTVLT